MKPSKFPTLLSSALLLASLTACDHHAASSAQTGAINPPVTAGVAAPAAPVASNAAAPAASTTLEGSGVPASRSVALNGGVRQIIADSSAVFTYNPSIGNRVVIVADDNLQTYINVQQDNGVLRVSPQADSVKRKTPIQVTWGGTAPLEIAVNGASRVQLHGFSGDALNVNISGSGDIIADGQVQRLTVTISGSGRFDGKNLVARDGEIHIPGSGNILLNVSDSLSGDIAGSGNVDVAGKPKTRAVNITGSANVNYL